MDKVFIRSVSAMMSCALLMMFGSVQRLQVNCGNGQSTSSGGGTHQGGGGDSGGGGCSCSF